MAQVIFFEQNVQNSYHNVLLNLHQAIDVNKLFNKSLILNPQVQTQSNVFHMISYFFFFFFKGIGIRNYFSFSNYWSGFGC